MSSQFVVLSVLLIALVYVSSAQESVRTNDDGNRYFMENNKLVVSPAVYRFLMHQNGAGEIQKRNNAEVVNHILKNFGALDRLGDVGRK